MGLLNRSKLLEKEKVQIERIDLGNDDFIFVRQMSGRDRDLFERSLFTMKKNKRGIVESYEQNMEDFRAKLCVCVICDEQGNLLLKPEDYTVLSSSMSAARLEKIVNIAQRMNKITEEDKEELLKNLEPVQEDNSNSDSVEN